MKPEKFASQLRKSINQKTVALRSAHVAFVALLGRFITFLWSTNQGKDNHIHRDDVFVKVNDAAGEDSRSEVYKARLYHCHIAGK